MIGFLDSGIGGVYVLKQCLKTCPNNHFVYLADNKNLPFGNKSKTTLQKIAMQDCEKLISCGCNIIVFACNTLTATAINKCRKNFPQIFFIGIEPAIMPALKTGEKILVLLTNATYKFSRLIVKNKKNKNLIFAPQKTLAEDIEKGRIISMQNYIKKEKVEGVVLGCTHYNLVKSQISSFLKTTNFFEASEGVAKRLSKFAPNNESQRIDFLFTAKDETKKYLKILKEKKA